MKRIEQSYCIRSEKYLGLRKEFSPVEIDCVMGVIRGLAGTKFGKRIINRAKLVKKGK